jgi:hypothetical protein
MRRALLFVCYVGLKCPYKEIALTKNHYSYGKRMRELAKKKKNEEKRERKQARRNPAPDENTDLPMAEE